MTEDEFRISHAEWLCSAGPEDMRLYEVALGYEDAYFADMTFQTDSILHDYLFFDVIGEEGVLHEAHSEISDRLSSLANSCYRFYVRKLPHNVGGRINIRDRMIEISPQHYNDPFVIMHEMIHAYEQALSEVDCLYRDILFMCLYKDLSKKIENLYTLILKHSHVFEAEDVLVRGGSHGILFFLKSLDLDLRCKYKLGTVCGYGRDEYCKSIDKMV